MMGYGSGWGWGFGGLWMLLFVVAGILVLAAAVKSLVFSRPQEGRGDVGSRALSVLEERYARGEINREEYLQKRDDLRR